MPKKYIPKKKEAQNVVISARLTGSEYASFLLSIADETGKSRVKPSAYLRSAALGVSVHIADAELERYRAFIVGKISNNLNQLAKDLHTQHKSQVVTEQTYQELLKALKALHAETLRLTKPIR